MPLDQATIDAVSPFFAQTSGGQLQAQQNQMSQFLQALQFQQQQAALSQANQYSTQFGTAPGGNWMQWGAGGPQQPQIGSPTLSAQQQAQAQAAVTAGMTGQYSNPSSWQYPQGSYVRDTLTGTIAQVGTDGRIVRVPYEDYKNLPDPRNIPTIANDAFNSLEFGPGQASGGQQTLQAQAQYAQLYGNAGQAPTSGQQTLAAQNQAFTQALQLAGLTGQFSQTPDALAQQGMSMDGTSFSSLPSAQQQPYLSSRSSPQQAAADWAKDANSALLQQGYKQTGQQTLAGQLQNAQLTGQYNGAPTEATREFNQQNALAQGQLTGMFNGAPTEAASEFARNFGLQQGQLTGTYNGAPTEAASEYARSLALQQGQLGQQYLSTAAQLQGPQNTFQLSNYLRGAAANPNVPVYLSALQNNMGLPSFQGAGNQAPTPASMGGLAAGMGAGAPTNGGTDTSGGATSGWNYGNTLDAIKGIASKGAQALGPGSLERLSPDELQAFGSGLGAAGYSLPSFMSQYNSSRVGQNAPVTAMGLS